MQSWLFWVVPSRQSIYLVRAIVVSTRNLTQRSCERKVDCRIARRTDDFFDRKIIRQRQLEQGMTTTGTQGGTQLAVRLIQSNATRSAYLIYHNRSIMSGAMHPFEVAKRKAAAASAPPPAASASGGGGDTSGQPAAAAAAAAAKPSAQMTAVMRVMAGMQERTIAEKLADSNRPTWEQYKKDNEDKLNISGLDQKKMEEYRKQLDAQREKILSRGLNHKKDKKKKQEDDDSDDSDGDGAGRKKRSRKHSSKSSKKKRKRRRDGDSNSGGGSSDYYSSDDDGSDDRRHRKRSSKKHKKKHKKHHRRSRHNSSSESDYSDESSSEDSRRKRKHHKSSKKRKHKNHRDKDRKSKSGKGGKDDESDEDAYRLSSFFDHDSD